MEFLRDSGVEWLGEIPNSWSIGKIKYYYKFMTGFTPDTSNPIYYDDGYTWVSIADLDVNTKYIGESKSKISDVYIREKRPQIVPKGSLLYSFKLSVGKKAFAAKSLYTNEAIGSFVKTKASNLNYLYYASSLIEENANINIYGAKLLNSSLINNSITVFPDLKEQQAIANYLDIQCSKIDSLITKIEKQISLLNDYKKSLITEVITKGLDPTVPMKDSGVEWIGEIPESWFVSKIKYEFVIVNGSTPDSGVPEYWEGNINWVTPADMKQEGDIFCGNRTITELGYKSCGTSLLPIGSITVSTRAPIGKINYVKQELCTNQGCKSLVNTHNDNRFWYYFLISKVDNLVDLGRGTTFMELSTTDFSNFPIIIPSGEADKEIVDFLEEKNTLIEGVISKKENQLTLLEEHKKSLIYEYVTGKKRVGGYENGN